MAVAAVRGRQPAPVHGYHGRCVAQAAKAGPLCSEERTHAVQDMQGAVKGVH